MSDVTVNMIEPGEWVLPYILHLRHGLSDHQINNYRCKGTWLEGKQFKYNSIMKRYVYNTESVSEFMAGNV